MIRGIIFDCFGVLYGSSTEVSRALCTADQLVEFDDLTKQADYGFIDGKEYLERLSVLINVPVEELQRTVSERHVRNTTLVDYIHSLRPQYRVGLLSNVSHGTMEQLITPEEQDELFDAVILSSDVHLIKPDPNVFTLAAERLGLLPDECVMIDDREENCEGASRAGLHTVWFASNEQAVAELERLLEGA